jgi:hypothetical protein
MRKESFTPTLQDLNRMSASKIALINKLAKSSPLFFPAIAALWISSTGHWKGISSIVNAEQLKEAKINLIYAASWIFTWIAVVALIIYSVNRELPEMIIT